MDDTERASTIPDEMEERRKGAAYHEAGHVVIAAAVGLRLRTEGLMIDIEAGGLGCYCKDPGESDILRAHVMVSTFAGFLAQNRFCKERSCPQVEYIQVVLSLDWQEARGIAARFSDEYLAGRSILTVQEELEGRSEQLVAENWPAIEAVANALLAKDWEPLKPLKSGNRWSEQSLAKYVTGEEVVRVLEPFGIAAACVSDC